ncbi:PREDICTED: MMS19 nucleotide excision repair protein homolog [Cyprinodon variegatus]|uniref:MMS19 nucleotide excision repair protein homolog n=1 Tax=Cyprinodon variegatus TaxID=28743 RepID=UPI00074278E8|nr:PREDICTED: MMS19 nucleotide excision repair protein homolog [Cyprinodon variegatus]
MRSPRRNRGAMAAESPPPLLLSLVDEFVSGLQDSRSKDAAKGVKEGQFSVLQLVEALGQSLTSTQPHTRARGVQLLSEVLQESYAELTEREVELLLAFYENRLKDHYVITPPVLRGLQALTKSRRLPPGAAVSMLKALFQDVHVQSLMLAERACVYNMLINLMESREDELKGLGADFVFGFVQSMDGERDPRNLLLAFQIARNILLRGYNLGKFTEELFEVTSCYFPIDFSPPPNDPHGITKEELIQALRAVLTGTPKFAEFLLPLIIEKLDSDVQSSKLDALQTLAACVRQYEDKDLVDFLEGLWSSLRREVFQTSSEKIESAALAALTALTSCLSRSVLKSDSEDSLSTFLDLVLKDCKHHLFEPDLKLVWPSAKLLQAACSASYRAGHLITAAVMPPLVEQYNSRTQCSHRRTLLEVEQRFIQSAAASCQSVDQDESLFSAYKDSLCSMVFSALSESNSSLQITAASLLTSLAQQTGLLSDSDIDLAVDHLTRLLLTDEDESVSLAVVECAGALAERHPAAFINKLIPTLKKEMFPDQREASELRSHDAVRQRCLSALAAVSVQASVVQESAPVLLDVLSSAHADPTCFSTDEVVHACLSLQKIAERLRDDEETSRCFHDVVIPRLLSLALQAALQSEGSCGRRSPLVEEAVLSAMVPVISAACSRPQTTFAEQTASRVVSLFLDGDVSFLPDNSLPSRVSLLQQQQQEDENSWRRSQLVCLLMACVCSFPRSVEVPQEERLLSALEELSCSCSHPLSYTSAAKCFAGLLNKKPEGTDLDGWIQRTVKRVSGELDRPSSSCRLQAFSLLIWVAKALLLRYHPSFSALTDKLFSLLHDADLGPMAADGFSLLMSDSTDVLNRGCHADVRIMYRQRFFSENSAKLVQGFNAAPKEKKPNFLKALSNIVNKLPKQVQVSELPALLSLLLEALTCPDEGVQLSTLSCLEPVLVTPPQVLIQQLEALVSRLLALVGSPSMKIRIASIRCVLALSHLPSHEVLPFRARVLRALAPPLDDRKRLVRREAVQARGEWFLLGSPGGR